MIKVDWSYDDLIKDIELPKTLTDLNNFDQAYFFTEGNYIIQGFLYIHNNKLLVIPEPEPSILYYANALRVVETIIENRDKIFILVGIENAHKIDVLFSDFYIDAFNFVINLFASIEAFNNSVIPEDFTYRDRKRLLNREKIQRFASPDLKIESIIPKIFGKSFIDDNKEGHLIISKLKNIRDNLIHTKNQSENWAASYRNIFRDLLSFDYEKALESAKEYMNFYKNDWIENK
ncbi:MAG: hypothetical protein M0Q53_19265 [Prolixibacteraceae bacterium]|nr:hypothetical protein [Prolixibacteraceae bacterium]